MVWRDRSTMRMKWLVLAGWVVLLAVAVPLAGRLTGAEKNDNAAWLPTGAESTRVLAELRRFQPADTMPAIVVYERPTGVTPADRNRAAADAAAMRAVPGVAGPVAGPVPAADGRALQLVVPVANGTGGWDDIARTVDGIRRVTRGGDTRVHITGPAGVL